MKQLVYAMRDRDTQLIKIGISVDPNVRAADVAKQFCADVELLGTLEVEDARKVERFMHNALATHRVMGEWFQPDSVTLGYVLAFFIQHERPSETQKAYEAKSGDSKSEMKAVPAVIEGMRAAMKERGLTQTALGKMAGIPQPSVARVLTGARGKMSTDLIKMLEALGLELVVQLKGGK